MTCKHHLRKSIAFLQNMIYENLGCDTYRFSPSNTASLKSYLTVKTDCPMWVGYP